MKTFKQLFEVKFGYKETPSLTQYTGRHFHRDDVAGHSVEVSFREKRHHPGHHSVEFDVDGDVGRTSGKHDEKRAVQHPEHRLAVLHHVRGVVDQFVKQKKPHSLRMVGIGSTDAEEAKKHKMYGTFAKDLAHRHGGTHKEVNGGHEVHFKT